MDNTLAITLLIGLFITSLVVYRITSLLVSENGPFDVFANLRIVVGVYYDGDTLRCKGKNVVASMLCCFKCTSIWIAWLCVGLFFYTPDPAAYFVRIMACSAIAIWLNRNS